MRYLWHGTAIEFASDPTYESPFRRKTILVPDVWAEICSTVTRLRNYFWIVTLLLHVIFHRYNMMTHYKAHQGIHRVNTKSFPCPICQVVLPKQSKLNEHLSVHHGSIPSSFKAESLDKYTNALPETVASSRSASLSNVAIDNGRLNSSPAIPDSSMLNLSITPDPQSLNIKKEKSYSDVFEWYELITVI